jgi:purine-binding chemotaxis protein CheW
MRALPIEPLGVAPSFIRGVSVVRGVPIPVVDLGLVLGLTSSDGGRFVTLRLGARQVALSVDAVVGVRDLDESKTQNLPPLLQGAAQDAIEAIGTLDAELLIVMRTGWELPDDVWQTLAAQEVAT